MPSWFTYTGLWAIVNAVVAILVAVQVVPSANDPVVVAVLGVINTILLAYFHVQTQARRGLTWLGRPKSSK